MRWIALVALGGCGGAPVVEVYEPDCASVVASDPGFYPLPDLALEPDEPVIAQAELCTDGECWRDGSVAFVMRDGDPLVWTTGDCAAVRVFVSR